jgi:hypothetical protein
VPNVRIDAKEISLMIYFSYLSIPLLLALQTITNWMFTDTTLGLSSWLQLGKIYSNVYLLKCARWAEKVKTNDRRFI